MEDRRLAGLVHGAARVQDLLGDLELALLWKDDPFVVLVSLKAAWREFRDMVLIEAPAGAAADVSEQQLPT